MSIIKKLFNCSRGYHEVAVSYLDISGRQFVEFQPPGPGGGTITYFRCAHCLDLFGVPGPVGDAPKKKAVKLDPFKMSEPVLMALAKKPWWPSVSWPPAPWPDPLGSTGGFHGGDVPGLPSGVDPMSPEGLAHIQTLLPQGAMTVATRGGGLPDPKKTPLMPDVPTPRPDPVIQMSRVALDIIEDQRRAQLLGGLNTLRQARKTSQEFAQALPGTTPASEDHVARQKVKDQVFAGMAKMISLLGTCCRLKVGCILLTEEGRLSGGGYNGAGPGMPHCESLTCNEHCRCARTVHAEVNALSYCTGVPYVAYVTAEPCCACAKELILAGVRRVIYLNPYTSISTEERLARQEWIDHYNVTWEQINVDPA